MNQNEDIPLDASVDLPPEGYESTDADDNIKTEPINPKDKHNWEVENFKNSTAFIIVAFCLLMVAIFTGVQFTWTGSRYGHETISSAIDVFKLIATTALGFLFGRNSK